MADLAHAERPAEPGPSVLCPDCGHDAVVADYTCHTWPSGTCPSGQERWMACQGCDSAIEYSCRCWLCDESDDVEPYLSCNCMWSYTHGFNPNNPRAAAMEEHRPPWLDPADRFTGPVKHPDVKWWWDD